VCGDLIASGAAANSSFYLPSDVHLLLCVSSQQDIESSHRPYYDISSSAGFKPLITLVQGSELAHLQGLAKAGGRLEQLQLSPMQLAAMVQDCAVTLDGEEVSAVAALLAALSSSSSSRARTAAAAAAAGDEELEPLAVCGLWPELGLMKQSCAANVTVTCLGDVAAADVGEPVEGALLVVRAAKDMPAGTEVSAKTAAVGVCFQIVTAAAAACTVVPHVAAACGRSVDGAVLVARAAGYMLLGTEVSGCPLCFPSLTEVQLEVRLHPAAVARQEHYVPCYEHMGHFGSQKVRSNPDLWLL
jgi:hypothetical protein